MPAHFILALMLSLILTVGFGIVLRMVSDDLRSLREDDVACAALAKVAAVEAVEPKPQPAKPAPPPVRAARKPAPPSKPVTPSGWTRTHDGNLIRRAG